MLTFTYVTHIIKIVPTSTLAPLTLLMTLLLLATRRLGGSVITGISSKQSRMPGERQLMLSQL